VQDSIKAVENVRKAGVRHVNIDLMYMIPGQTINEWVSDLEHAASLDVDEITCYPTLIVEYSLGYRMIKEGKLPEQPEANEFKKMMYACEDILPERGYRGLEIYGYSRVGDWKYVTVNYEMEGPLIAFGAGAMGFTGEYEYQNICYPEQYGKQVSAGKLPIAFSRDVSPSERAVRYITCRLFICRVLDKGEFRRKVGEEFGKIIEDTGFKWPLRMLKISRDVVEDRKEVKLTRKGLFTAHKICWSFVLNVPCRMVEKCLTKPCPEVVTIPD
jgi:oxygen-independent coproporphyrinogen-3 oxidase